MSVVCTILFRRVCRPPSSRHSRPCIAPSARISAEKAPGVVGSCTCVHQRHVWGRGGSPRRPGGSKRRTHEPGPLARRRWVPPPHRGGPRQSRPQSTRHAAAARGRRSAARPFSPTCSPPVSELRSERASERERMRVGVWYQAAIRPCRSTCTTQRCRVPPTSGCSNRASYSPPSLSSAGLIIDAAAISPFARE
jgi:hypothetical protein